MSSEATGYTAGQYLEAGYRAESNGDRDRAHQYYAYVAEAFAETPEGEAARGGLIRLGFPVPADPHTAAGPHEQAAGWPHADAGHGQMHTRPMNGSPQPAGASPGGPQPAWQAPQQARPTQPRAQPQPAQQPAPGAGGQRIVLGELARLNKLPPGQHPDGRPQQHAAAPMQQPATHELPTGDRSERLPEVVARRQRELAEAEGYEPPARKFRSGRVMAWLFVIGGWLSVAGGIAAIALGFVFSTMGGSVMGIGLGTVAGIGALIGGLMMVMLGQLALAVFENTEAVREIAWLVRSRSEL